MKRYRMIKAFLFAVCLSLVESANAHGHQDFKAVSVEQDTLSELRRGRVPFDPLAYRMQKRYLPQGDTLRFRRFWERFFVGGHIGVQQFVPKSEVETKAGPALTLFLGYRLSHLHALRASASYQEYERKLEAERLKQLGGEVDYLFNLTSYLYGHRHHRLFSLSPFVGAGLLYSSFEGVRRKDVKVYGGLHFAYHPGRNSELFLEPFLAATSDGADFAFHASKYDVLYGLRGGMSLNADMTSPLRPRPATYNGNVFFDLSQGATMNYHRNTALLKTMGTNYYGAVGMWLTSVLGVRAGGSVADYYWLKEVTPAQPKRGGLGVPRYVTRSKGALFSARVEALLNPVMFSEHWRNTPHKVDVNLSLGLEGGFQGRVANARGGQHGRYIGVTAATQLLYNVNPTSALFLEARAQVANYNAYRGEGTARDYLGSVNVGVRAQRPTRKQLLTLGKTPFEPHFFVGGQLGGVKQIVSQKQEGDKAFNLLLGVNAGYHFSPFAGMKLQMEYMALNRNRQTPYEVTVDDKEMRGISQWRHTYGLMNLKAAYMLNLSNVYQRYDASRRLNVYAVAGPMFSMYVNQIAKPYSKVELTGGTDRAQALTESRIGNRAWALFGGLQADYRLNGRWSLYLEPEVQYYLQKDFIGGSPVARLNDLIVKFSLGTTYRFSDDNSPFRKRVNHNRNIFFDLSQGATMKYAPRVSDILRSMGTNYYVAAGMWLTPAWGVRVGGSVADYYWKSTYQRARFSGGTQLSPEYETKSKGFFFTGRGEILMNPLMFSEHWRTTPHLFDVNFSLGLEAGWQWRQGSGSSAKRGRRRYVGPTFATQLLYNVNTSTALFVEARGQLPTYRLAYSNSSELGAFTDKIGSVNVGVRVMRPTRAELKVQDKTPFESHFFVGGQLGGVKHVVSSKLAGDGMFNLLTAVNGGYHYAPFVGAKFQMEYMMLDRSSRTSYEVMTDGRTRLGTGQWRHSYGLLNLKAAYMLNMTNFYQGYDAKRRLNLYAVAGPMYSVFVSQGSELYSEESVAGSPKALVKDMTGSGAWALFGGLQADYRLNDKWSLYLEPEVQYYLKEGFIGGAPKTRLNDMILKFSVGTTYRF